MEILAWLVLILLFVGVVCPILAVFASYGESNSMGYIDHCVAGLLWSFAVCVFMLCFVGCGLAIKWAVSTLGI